jgi:hypothetical protein
LEIDCQSLAPADRAGIPIVLTLDKTDWTGEIDITHVTSPVTGMYDADGFWYNPATIKYEAVISRAAGFGMLHMGPQKTKSNLQVANQTQLNTLAALLLAVDNNEYPSLSLTLAENNRFLDIGPCQFVTISLAAGDTPRGVSFSAKHFIPRKVQFLYSGDAEVGGMITVSVDFEAEVFPGMSIAAPMPLTPFNNILKNPYTPPVIPPVVVPPINPLPPGDTIAPPPTPGNQPPSGSCLSNMSAPANGPYNLYMSGDVYDYGPRSVIYGTPGTPMYIRTSGHTNQTRVAVQGVWSHTTDNGDTWVADTDMSHWQILAYDDYGNVITTGTWDSVTDSGQGVRWATMSVPAGVHVARFGFGGYSGSPVYVTYPQLLASGPIPVTAEGGTELLDQVDVDSNGLATTLDAGSLYSVNGLYGPWWYGIPYLTPSWNIEEGYSLPQIRTLSVSANYPGNANLVYPTGTEAGVTLEGNQYYVVWNISPPATNGYMTSFSTGAYGGAYGSFYCKIWLNSVPTPGTDAGYWMGWNEISNPQNFPSGSTISTIAIKLGYSTTAVGYCSVYGDPVYNFSGSGVHLDMTSLFPNHRIYFYGSTVNSHYNWVRVGDTAGGYGDNSGVIHYELHRAALFGERRASIGSIQIYNICGG